MVLTNTDGERMERSVALTVFFNRGNVGFDMGFHTGGGIVVKSIHECDVFKSLSFHQI